MSKEIKYDPIFDAQIAFRILLNAFSHPGEVYTFENFSLSPPSNFNISNTVIALSLFDHNISFHSACSFDKTIEEYIHLNTYAKVETLYMADYIFMNGCDNNGHLINECKTGELSYPEKNATLIISIDQISSQMNDLPNIEFILSGPGIKDQNKIHTRGLTIQNALAIKMVNEEFPLGIDVILTDIYGNICAIPRSSQFQIIQNH